MANSVDPDQTAPIGAVCSGPTLFASIKLFSCSTQLSMTDMYGETWWPQGYKTVFMLNSTEHE